MTRSGRGKPKDPFIAYLSCACCGHWWPLGRRQLKCLIDPAWFVCPYCHQGRKRACDSWDYQTRRPAVPERLDVRLADAGVAEGGVAEGGVAEGARGT